MEHDIPYSRCYASDSDDDGPDEDVDEEGFTVKEAEAFEKVVGRDHRIPLFSDLTLADEATVDGGKGIVLEARPTSYRDMNHVDNGITPGLRFATLLEFQMWIKEYSVKYHRPFKVAHSDKKKRYTVRCLQEGCPWEVRARPLKKGPDWHITSCVATHMCRGKKVDGNSRQFHEIFRIEKRRPCQPGRAHFAAFGIPAAVNAASSSAWLAVFASTLVVASSAVLAAGVVDAATLVGGVADGMAPAPLQAARVMATVRPRPAREMSLGIVVLSGVSIGPIVIGPTENQMRDAVDRRGAIVPTSTGLRLESER
jgi:hypothetical protein